MPLFLRRNIAAELSKNDTIPDVAHCMHPETSRAIVPSLVIEKCSPHKCLLQYHNTALREYRKPLRPGSPSGKHRIDPNHVPGRSTQTRKTFPSTAIQPWELGIPPSSFRPSRNITACPTISSLGPP